MIKDLHIIRDSAAKLATAIDATVESCRDSPLEPEPQFTDRMLSRIEQVMDGYKINGIEWRAKTLTDSAPHAQGKTFRADFVGVLEIEVDGYSVKKGFLAQARRAEPGETISVEKYEELKEQCERMLAISPASYLFVYSQTGVTVTPALAVISSTRRNPHDLYSRSAQRFFENHFECFVGDRRIHTPSFDAIASLRTELNARSVLALRATSLQGSLEFPE